MLTQDLRFGLRQLKRGPGFAVLAVLCLGLGIGSIAAALSWVEGILLRPYPLVAGQENLVVVASLSRGASGPDGLSWPDFLDLRRQSTVFEALAADNITGAILSEGDRAQRIPGQIVSADYFDAVQVRPLLGRGFTPDEEVGRNAHPTVVISYRMWQERFRGDPAIIGKPQLMNGVIHTIVGVAPRGFAGTFVGYEVQFWVPASMQETFTQGGYQLEDRGAHWVETLARLKPGVSRAQAEQELGAIARRLEEAYPGTNRGQGIALYPLWRAPFNNAGALFPTLRIALVVAAFVLLIACANVSNLLLVRALARRKEIAIRLAIGSSRGRLVRQLVTEGLLLSAAAAGLGFLLAHWGRNLMVLAVPPRSMALSLPAALDWRVLALGLAVCLLLPLLFAPLPALAASRIDLVSAIKQESGSTPDSHRSTIRTGLVVLQIALSFLLVVGAGLLVRSLAAMRDASPGFDTRDVVIGRIDLNLPGYTPDRRQVLQDELLARVRALPGVETAAYARIAPFGYRSFSEAAFSVDGYQSAADEQPAAEFDEISPAYLATIGVPILEGRDFALTDDRQAPAVAIVNQAMAARYWPGSSPIGHRIRIQDQPVEVVGLARTVSYGSLLEAPKPFFYLPLRQRPASQVILHIRTGQSPAQMAGPVAQAARSLDPGMAALDLMTLQQQVERKAAPQSLALALLGIFAGLALFLATIGLYGVMSYAVSQRTRELGLRMALGADRSNLLGLVMKGGFRLALAGIATGAVLALLLTRLLGNLLYQVGPRDPLSFGLAATTLIAAAGLACLVPAWRAILTDPLVALRS